MSASVSSPRLLFIVSHLEVRESPSLLARVARQVVSSFAGRAEVQLIDLPISKVLPYACRAEIRGEADAIICTGATGAYLRQQLSIPIVPLSITGADVIQALEEAFRYSRRVAVLSTRNNAPDLAALQRLCNLKLTQGSYSTRDEAERLVDKFRDDGIEVVIGTSMVCEMARERGLNGVLAISTTAIESALEEALSLLMSERAEATRLNWINASLRHLSEGVIAVDSLGSIQALNAVASSLLGLGNDEAITQSIHELVPELDVRGVLDSAVPDKGRVLTLNGHSVAVQTFPIFDNARLVGAVTILQESTAVSRIERQLRMNSRRTEFRARYSLDTIVGSSASMHRIVKLSEIYARSDCSIVIIGESGTGKELFAQGIHNASRRAKRAFVAFNCAAFPESLIESELFGYEEGAFSGARKGGKPGLFELAHMGTIFLDEIGDMPLLLQTRLLRVIQERETIRLGGTQPVSIDVRIIAATHRNLAERVKEGLFREDLYYRLNVLQLNIPPLRERGHDLYEIALSVIREVGSRHGLHQTENILDSWMPTLKAHHWPGNVRELENVIERLALHAATEKSDDLLDELWPERHQHRERPSKDEATASDQPISEFLARQRQSQREEEVELIKQAIAQAGGNVVKAARELGISRSTLWRRLRPD